MTSGKDLAPKQALPNTVVVGCGYWGKNLVRNFSEIGALAALCDSDSEVAERMADSYGVPAISFGAALADPKISSVAIAAPAEQHYTLAKQAMLAGKDVFVEKPLALVNTEAEELAKIADANGRILMVGHLLQYHPCFQKIPDLIAERSLGRIQYIYSNRLNFGKIRTEENALWSFAPHDISMILSLAGQQPSEVSAVGFNCLHDDVADITTMHIKFGDGIAGHVHVSWLHPFKEQRLVIVCENGMVVFDDGQDWTSKLSYFPHRVEWDRHLPVAAKADGIDVAVEPAEPLRNECMHFLECVRDRQTPRTDGWEGVRVLNVLNSADNSLKQSSNRMNEQDSEDYFAHSSAVIDIPSDIGAGTKIWHFSHILKDVTVGENCTIGQNVMIGPNVSIGNGCKIQNNVSVYDGVSLSDNVFCGPSVVFTNVKNPRASIEKKDEFLATNVGVGATIGANATIVCGTTLGDYCFVAAGAVVANDVPPHALVAGVPARQTGWVSHAGEVLGEDLRCPRTGDSYKVDESGVLVLVEP